MIFSLSLSLYIYVCIYIWRLLFCRWTKGLLGRAIPTQGVTPGRSGSPRAVGGRDVAGLFHGGGRSGRGRAVAGALYFFARWLQLRSEILLSRSRRLRGDPGVC